MTPINILVIVAILIGYPIASRLILTYAQTRRIKLAHVGKQILEHGEADPELKGFVRSMLNDAYSPWLMLTMVFAIPVMGFIVLVTQMKFKPVSRNPEVLRLFDEFIDLHIFATSAANPICAVLVGAEMAVLTLLLFPFGQGKKAGVVQFAALKRAERLPESALAA